MVRALLAAVALLVVVLLLLFLLPFASVPSSPCIGSSHGVCKNAMVYFGKIILVAGHVRPMSVHVSCVRLNPKQQTYSVSSERHGAVYTASLLGAIQDHNKCGRLLH